MLGHKASYEPDRANAEGGDRLGARTGMHRLKTQAWMHIGPFQVRWGLNVNDFNAAISVPRQECSVAEVDRRAYFARSGGAAHIGVRDSQQANPQQALPNLIAGILGAVLQKSMSGQRLQQSIAGGAGQTRGVLQFSRR